MCAPGDNFFFILEMDCQIAFNDKVSKNGPRGFNTYNTHRTTTSRLVVGHSGFVAKGDLTPCNSKHCLIRVFRTGTRPQVV